MPVKHILTPLQQGGDGLAPLPASGEWIARHGFDDLAAIATRMRVDDLGEGLEDLISIPDVWAQVEIFRNSLLEADHPLHDRSVGEWRGLLALFALAGHRQYSLRTEVVPLARIADPTSPEERLSEILRRTAPATVAVPGLTWDDIATLHIDEQLVGLVVPTTLVCPARGYAGALVGGGVPWIDSEGRLSDPCESRNLKTEQLLLLHAFLTGGRDSRSPQESDAASPRGLEAHLLSLATGSSDDYPLASALVGQVQEFAASVQSRLGGLSPARVIVSTAGLNLPQHDFYTPLGEVIEEADVTVGFDTLLTPRPEFQGITEGAIVFDESIASAWERGKAEKIRVWRLWDLDRLIREDQVWPRVAEDIERHGYMALQADDFFTPTLTELTAVEAPGHADSAVVATEDLLSSYVLPLNPLILLFFEPQDLRKRVRIKRQPSGQAIVTLDLELEDQGHQRRTHTLTKVYHASSIDRREAPTALGVWPNFASSTWKHYYVYCGREPYQLRASLPLSPNLIPHLLSGVDFEKRQAKLKVLHEASDLPDIKLEAESDDIRVLLQLTEAPEAIVCMLPAAADSSSDAATELAGLVLLPELEQAQQFSGTWMIGIDFGTTNTSACIRRPDGTLKAVAFNESRVLLPLKPRDKDDPGSSRNSFFTYDFIPKQEVEVPFLGVLRDRRLPRQDRVRPIWDAHIGFVTSVVTMLEDLNDLSRTLRFNLKWSDEIVDRDEIELYITQVLLHSLAEAVAEGADPSKIVWKFGYPEAFTPSRYDAFRHVYRNAIWRTLDATMKENEPAFPVMVSESLSTALYFQSKKNAHFVSSAITIDIGGHTSDITVWQNRELIWRSSLEFGGQHIFVDYLRQNLEFFNDLASTEGSLSQINDALQEVRPERLKDGLEVVINSPDYRSALKRSLHKILDLPPGMGFRHIAEFSMAGIVYYLGLMVRHLIGEGLFENGRPTLYFCLGGRSSIIFKQLIPEESRRQLSELFQSVSGYTQQVELFTFSDDPKLEVAYGLLGDGEAGALALSSKRHRDSVLGEDLLVDGQKLSAESTLSQLPTSKPWEVDNLSHLIEFMGLYERHMERKLELTPNQRNHLIGAVNSALAQARAEAERRLPASDESLTLEQLVALEPPFVVGLRTVVEMLNQGALKIETRI